jgi:hypothetical protein
LLDRALEALVAGRASGRAAQAHSPAVAAAHAGSSPGHGLDEAVDGLRAAGSSHHVVPGLLARAAYHRDAGNDMLASKDLTEAFEIAERGGMRLFLADCWLESARQQLARPQPIAAALTAAANAIDRAAAIVAETGYHRRDPDLALARAELALANGDAAGARPHLDALIALMREHDLWSFLPELNRLAERHKLASLAPTLADLAAQRARFDAAADAAFEEARKSPARADGLDDDVIDARLADRKFLMRLGDILQANGHELGKLSVEQRRQAAREYIQKVERQQEPASKLGIDPDSIPDDLVSEMLGQAEFRKMLDEALAASGNPRLADLDAGRRRGYARAMIAAMAEARSRKDAAEQPSPDPSEEQQDSGVDPDSIPDELVNTMLGRADFRKMLDEALVASGRPRLGDLKPDRQREYARAMIAAIAQAESPKDAGDGPAPRPEPPQRDGGVLRRMFGAFMPRKR